VHQVGDKKSYVELYLNDEHYITDIDASGWLIYSNEFEHFLSFFLSLLFLTLSIDFFK